MVRPRLIDPFLAVRFVGAYRGEPGRAFRVAMAEHFGVDARTVERELPRLVSDGLLEEETLPRRGAPKAYRVSARAERAQKSPWRTMLGRGPGPRAKKRGMSLAAERVGVPDEEFLRFFHAGVVAFCDRCGRSEVVYREDETPHCQACRVRVPGDADPPKYTKPLMSRAVGYPLEREPRPRPKPMTREEVEAALKTREEVKAALRDIYGESPA